MPLKIICIRDFIDECFYLIVDDSRKIPRMARFVFQMHTSITSSKFHFKKYGSTWPPKITLKSSSTTKEPKRLRLHKPSIIIVGCCREMQIKGKYRVMHGAVASPEIIISAGKTQSIIINFAPVRVVSGWKIYNNNNYLLFFFLRGCEKKKKKKCGWPDDENCTGVMMIYAPWRGYDLRGPDFNGDFRYYGHWFLYTRVKANFRRGYWGEYDWYVYIMIVERDNESFKPELV